MAHQHRYRRALLALGCLAAVSARSNAAAQSVDFSQFRDRVIALLNQQRVASGVPTVKRSATLEAAAQSYSDVMMRATAGGPVYLAHTGPDGSSLGQRVTAAGYNWFSLGEDLAAGQKSPEQVVSEWMGSPLHRDNLLSPEYREVGIGISMGPGTWSDGRLDPRVLWWTADFGTGPDSDRDGGPVPGNPVPLVPPPTITGYATLIGAPVRGAQFGSLLQIAGQNLGFSGSITFHGRATGAVFWTPTSVLVFVPLQPSYPDVGPISLTVGGQTATGTDFTTLQPGSLPAVLPATTYLPPALPGSGSSPAVGASLPTITDLVNASRQRIGAVSQGTLFSLRGKAFGTNSSHKGRVLYTGPGGQRDAAIWSWADDTITLFAPYLHGTVTVTAQVDASGARIESNRMTLVVQ